MEWTEEALDAAGLPPVFVEDYEPVEPWYWQFVFVPKALEINLYDIIMDK
jgi:hypothetical protein